MREIIEKWYKKLNFPSEYDSQFYKMLSEEALDEKMTIDTYDKNCKNGRKNFLAQLYFLEALHERYVQKGIPEKIFSDTAQDLVKWTKTWTDIKGELWQGEFLWLSLHLSFRLFHIGRLQFCMHYFDDAIDEYGIKKGDNAVDVHIPASGALDIGECRKSFAQANAFFESYFPDFHYRFFMCHSWLLDKTLKKYLKPGSNILSFQKIFTPVREDVSDDIFKYCFKWNTRRENIGEFKAETGFAEGVKQAAYDGEVFYCTLGITDKTEFGTDDDLIVKR